MDAINNRYEEGVLEGTMKIHADDFLTELSAEYQGQCAG